MLMWVNSNMSLYIIWCKIIVNFICSNILLDWRHANRIIEQISSIVFLFSFRFYNVLDFFSATHESDWFINYSVVCACSNIWQVVLPDKRCFHCWFLQYFLYIAAPSWYLWFDVFSCFIAIKAAPFQRSTVFIVLLDGRVLVYR